MRYRPARFNNRVYSKHKGWLAPSVEQKINSHIQVIKRLYAILPITKLIVETAQFDIQKINNPEISGKEYQQGEQLGFWNVRAYVLFRDHHECQCCHGKSKDNVLNVHHIESRKAFEKIFYSHKVIDFVNQYKFIKIDGIHSVEIDGEDIKVKDFANQYPELYNQILGIDPTEGKNVVFGWDQTPAACLTFRTV